jgi:hypothetical protein
MENPIWQIRCGHLSRKPISKRDMTSIKPGAVMVILNLGLSV